MEKYLMKNRARKSLAGLSMGAAALAVVAVAATPAAAAVHSLDWHVKKSTSYCASLYDGTSIGAMKKAACDSQVMSTQMMVTQQAIQTAMGTAEIASKANWPGPGH
ncbi:hypothetical protein STRCI_008095 [Streptomyces cinnabarinus]|uniref:Uncharacterized protein n=1 Tax=Streptomyces cinnabarinus TaxID=67287 RepID=A0ABY7KTT9_9ACTN|nr:hypothetical protein [Streptomyces cinnabarinus]WAZ26512.1 hypothetical protein STRCI_008095 [Streptomyces cinnabarinus]